MAIKKKVTKKKAKKKVAKKKSTKKKTKTNPKGAGAELKAIDWDSVDGLCAIQCTGEEIASFLKIDYDTLQRACKRDKKSKFADYIGQKRKRGNVSLRRRQWKLAMKGNPIMNIWLGKQYLNQTDKKEITGAGGGPQEHVVMDKKEYEKVRAKMLKDDDV